MDKSLPLFKISEMAAKYGTPFWLYDKNRILDKVSQLKKFDTVRYAQKALSNIHILRVMHNSGLCVDSVSIGEVERALLAGFEARGEPAGIVFTSDVLDQRSLDRIQELGIEVNAGSIDMLQQLGEVSPGHRVWIRINPGFGHGHNRKTNTGGINSKHGIWHDQVDKAIEQISKYDLELVGIHIHIGSGVDYEHLEYLSSSMVHIVENLGVSIEAFSIGGGLPTPYRPDEKAIDIDDLYAIWSRAQRKIEDSLGHKVRMEIEPGRFLVAECGYLVCEVRATKMVSDNLFILVDAGLNDLMRPALYGSYHHMTLVDKNGIVVDRPLQQTVVAGPLCESGDVFTQNEFEITPRSLPKAQVGDLLIIHDAGAYGASMSSNYNSRTLLPEVLIEDGEIRLIRCRQDMSDLLELEMI